MQDRNKYAEAFELIQSGYQYQKRGKIRQAIRKYKASIKVLPTAEAHTYLGWALSLVGKYDKAIKECYQAIYLDEEYGNSYNDLGYYLTLFKRYDEAIEWLGKAIAAPRFNDRHWGYYNLGRVYEVTCKYNLALKAYCTALELHSSFGIARDGALRVQGMLN